MDYFLLSRVHHTVHYQKALKVLCRELTTHEYLHTTALRMYLLEFIVCSVYQSKESCVNYQHRPASNTWGENSKTLWECCSCICLCVQGTDTCRLTQQEFCFDSKTNHLMSFCFRWKITDKKVSKKKTKWRAPVTAMVVIHNIRPSVSKQRSLDEWLH